MGDANLGLTYTTQDGKPVCLIYRYNEVVIEVPVSLPPFQFEVHKSKLFYHDAGSGEWWETPKFWGLSDNVQETLSDWATAKILAEIETVDVQRLTMDSLHQLVPKWCQKCTTFAIVSYRSQQFGQRFCKFCTNEKKSEFAMGDEDLGIVYEHRAGKPFCLIYRDGRIKETVPVVSPTVQFRLEGHKLFYMPPNEDLWYQIDRFWRVEQNRAAILSKWDASLILSMIESRKYRTELAPVKCTECKLIDIVPPKSQRYARRLCSACITTTPVKFTFGDESLGLTYDTRDQNPVCILYENGNAVAELTVTWGPIKFEVRNAELLFFNIHTKHWINGGLFWAFSDNSAKSLKKMEEASILARLESMYFKTETGAYQCRRCSCISIRGVSTAYFRNSLCRICLDQTPEEVDNPTTEEHKTCTVCMENEIRVSLQPCGHTVLCFKCSTELKRDKAPCPICRAEVTQRIKVFLP